MPRIPLRKNDDFYKESVLACSRPFPITCNEAIVDEEKMERAMGIEPTYQAWEARVLPLNYARRLLFRRGRSLAMAGGDVKISNRVAARNLKGVHLGGSGLAIWPKCA